MCYYYKFLCYIKDLMWTRVFNPIVGKVECADIRGIKSEQLFLKIFKQSFERFNVSKFEKWKKFLKKFPEII